MSSSQMKDLSRLLSPTTAGSHLRRMERGLSDDDEMREVSADWWNEPNGLYTMSKDEAVGRLIQIFEDVQLFPLAKDLRDIPLAPAVATACSMTVQPATHDTDTSENRLTLDQILIGEIPKPHRQGWNILIEHHPIYRLQHEAGPSSWPQGRLQDCSK